MSKAIVILILLSLGRVGFAFTDKLQVTMHVIENSGWTHEELNELKDHTIFAFGECGIEVSISMNQVSNPSGSYQHLKNYFETAANNTIARTTKVDSSVNVYFTKYQEGILGPLAGQAIRWIPDDNYLPLKDTVWISREPLKALSEKLNTPIPTVMTHEIGHVLSLEHSYRKHDIMDNGSNHYEPIAAHTFYRKQCRQLKKGITKLFLLNRLDP